LKSNGHILLGDTVYGETRRPLPPAVGVMLQRRTDRIYPSGDRQAMAFTARCPQIFRQCSAR